MNQPKDDVKRCARCVTPVSYPGASLDSEGICFFCKEYDRIWGSSWEKGKASRSRKFEDILNKARRKAGDYEVLVPLSGGKDSTYVLYLMTKAYSMRTLAFTFDNGFISPVARENIRKAIEASGADHYMYKINPRRMMRLYRHFFEHAGLFCPICMRGISVGYKAVRRQHRIPLIVRGTSMRTEEWVTREIFQDGHVDFFKNVLRKYPVDVYVEDLYAGRSFGEKLSIAIQALSRGRISLGIMDIQAPDYFDWNYDVVYNTIHREFGWERLPDRDEHVDCLIDPVVHYIRRKKVPELTDNTLRYSAMIRSGMMKRKRALELIREEMTGAEIPPPQTTHLISQFEITADQFEDWSRPDLRHMKYQSPGTAMRLFTLARRLVGDKNIRK